LKFKNFKKIFQIKTIEFEILGKNKEIKISQPITHSIRGLNLTHVPWGNPTHS